MTKKTLEEEIMEELANEKNTSGAKKPNKEKKLSSVKDSNALIKPLIILILGIWIGSGALIGGIDIGIAKQLNDNAERTHTDTLTNSAATTLNYQFYSTQKQLNSLANSKELENILNEDTLEAQNTLAAILKNSFNHAESLLIIPWDYTGTVGLKNNNIQLRNSIEMSMITKIGNQKKTVPEAYLYEKKWLVSFAAPITKEKQVIGALLLTLNSQFLKETIDNPYFTEAAKIEIINKQQKGTSIVTVGKANSNNPGHFDLPFTGGELIVHVGVDNNNSIRSSFIIIYIVIGIGALLLTALTFAIYILNLRAIRQDCDSIVRFAESKSGIHKTKMPKLTIPALSAIIVAIENLSLNIEKNGVTPRAQTVESSNNKTVTSPSVQSGPPPELIGKADVNEGNHFEHPEIFRDYDIRGIADKQLTPDVVIMIGKAIGSEAVTQGIKSIIVGRDGRLSSERIKKNLIKGLSSSGCDVIDIDLVPSPVLYYATHKLGTQSGVMITGSHNPLEYNGFKIILGGKTLEGAQLQNLLKRIEDYNFSEGQGSYSSHSITDDYIEEISLDIILAKPLKVVLDASNGAGGEIATRLFSQLDCQVMPLNCTIDGNFPGHGPDPSNPENLADLIQNVVAMGADIGIAFDGDADRMVAVTSTGKIVAGDQLLMIFAKDIVSRNPAADVIFDIKCSNNINKLITEFGGRPIISKSGHSHIKAKMQETGALLGGEYTGHFFFKERWYGFDDAIYSALRLIELLTTDEETLDDRIASLPSSYSTNEIIITVDTEASKLQIIDTVKNSLSNEQGNINTIDGIRIDYENGWGLVRASNTSTALSCRFEADSEDELMQIQNIFKNALLAAKPDLLLTF